MTKLLDMAAAAIILVLPIILSVLCFNLLGDGLRDAADPYSK
jgi:ABC-type dipeptide/oligopeptide/nickel transport system permease subunit